MFFHLQYFAVKTWSPFKYRIFDYISFFIELLLCRVFHMEIAYLSFHPNEDKDNEESLKNEARYIIVNQIKIKERSIKVYFIY